MIIFKNIKIVLTVACLIFSFATMEAYSSEESHGIKKTENHEHSEHEDSKADKDHKSDAGFEISKKAIKLMQIGTIKVKSMPPNKFSVPRAALVMYGEEYGLYKYDGEHFKLITLNLIKKNKNSITIESHLLSSGDQVVVKGLPLLRVTHLQLSGQGGEGHGH